jgi:CRP-like cAMP-binding protein/rhodanese-related sulfurtransferase
MADKKEKIRRLADTKIFSSVPEEQLAEIAKILKDKVVPKKTVIFKEGDPGDSFYIVHSGKVRVFLKGKDGVETELNRLGPGDSFGEIALLTDKERSTDVETAEDSHLFVLTKEELDTVIQSHPEIFRNFIRHMSDLLKQDDKKIQKDTEREHQATRLSLFDFVFIGIVILLFSSIFNISNPNRINVIPKFHDPEEISKVDMPEAKDKYDNAEVVFIDARPSSFYNKLHIKGALNLPLPTFEINYMFLSDQDKTKEVIVYGRSIGAQYDEEVARLLRLNGHENVQILKGKKPYQPLRWVALDTWKEKGYPTEGEGAEHE